MRGRPRDNNSRGTHSYGFLLGLLGQGRLRRTTQEAPVYYTLRLMRTRTRTEELDTGDILQDLATRARQQGPGMEGMQKGGTEGRGHVRAPRQTVLPLRHNISASL